jgi:hypothetical protein
METYIESGLVVDHGICQKLEIKLCEFWCLDLGRSGAFVVRLVLHSASVVSIVDTFRFGKLGVAYLGDVYMSEMRLMKF